MSKHSWETVLAKCKELDLKPESVLKVVQRMSGKDRAETPREILRASWVNDVAYHVYHRIGTNHDKKIPTKKLIRNYVKTKHYQECYRTFFLKEWDQLPSIRKSKFTNEIDKTRALVESHTSNCQKLLLSKAGKKQLAFLIMSGGNMLEVPGTKIEYLKNLRKGLKKINKPKTKTFLEQVGFRIDKSGNIIKI
ncbi:MAG TPA: hypothetical protein DCS66_21240 [Flavobacteriaceae bacterium]|nr:hypothetical protein [Flavobacteriaceae bacterium]